MQRDLHAQLRRDGYPYRRLLPLRTLMRHELRLSMTVSIRLLPIGMIAAPDPAGLMPYPGASKLLMSRILPACFRAVPLAAIARSADQETKQTTMTATLAKLHQPPPVDAISTSAAASIMLNARSSGSTVGRFGASRVARLVQRHPIFMSRRSRRQFPAHPRARHARRPALWRARLQRSTARWRCWTRRRPSGCSLLATR